MSDARAEIHDLLVRLAIAQDDHDWDTLTAHFAPDAVYDHPGGRLVGVDDIAQHVRHGNEGGDLFAIAGSYRDELARIAGRWQITHRTQSYSWRHGNPAVTRPPPPDTPG